MTIRTARLRALLLPLSAIAIAAGCESQDLLEGLPDAGANSGTCERIVYFNRNPTVFTVGMTDSIANTTDIVNGPTTTSPLSISDGAWQRLLGCVRVHLSPFDVQVVDADPGAVDHLEIVVTTSAAELGLPETVINVSATSCGSNRRGIGFVFLGSFTDQLDTPQVCKVVTQPVGALAGAYWSRNPDDIMSFAIETPPVGFVDGDHACGGFSAESCPCTNESTQNTYQVVGDYFAGACGDGG